MKNEYDLQSEKFLKDTKTTFKAKYLGHGCYFVDDIDKRDIYEITLCNFKRSYRFKFGQSISSTGKAPQAYDVLACLTSSDPGSFERFCQDCGYDVDSKAEKIYFAVKKEYNNLCRLFTFQELEQLSEIR